MNSRKVVLSIVIALVVWKAGGPVVRAVLGILASTFGAVFGSSGAVTSDPSSLRAAFRNVTTDYDQLSILLQDFFRQHSHLRQDNSTEVALRDFLGQRASKSRPILEQSLDWILAIYKVIWPVLVVFLISKLNSGKSPPEEEADEEPGAASSGSRWSSGKSRLPNGEVASSQRQGSIRKQRSYPHRTTSGTSRSAQLASTKSSLS